MSKDKSTVDLYLTLRSGLIDYAASILGCRARAEDIVQDAYVRVSTSTHNSTASGLSVAHPAAYIYRTVRNLSFNWIRRQRTEGEIASAIEWETLASQGPSPEHEALYRDELRAVAAALDDLPDRTRRAFELHRLRGYTFPQVAGCLGISVGLAHQLVRDALTHCADRLGDDDQ